MSGYTDFDGQASTLDNTPRIYNTSQEHPILRVYMGRSRLGRPSEQQRGRRPVALYAPEATVTLEKHGRIDGGVIARQVSLESNTAVVPASGTGALASVDAAPFDRGAYHECSSSPPGTGPTPDSGCSGREMRPRNP